MYVSCDCFASLTVSNLVICVWKDTVSSATRMFGLRQISGQASARVSRVDAQVLTPAITVVWGYHRHSSYPKYGKFLVNSGRLSHHSLVLSPQVVAGNLKARTTRPHEMKHAGWRPCSDRHRLSVMYVLCTDFVSVCLFVVG